jgi:hypothetical protein
MELYNEKIYDLLDDEEELMLAGASPKKKSGPRDLGRRDEGKDYAIVEDTRGGMGTYVRGLKQIVRTCHCPPSHAWCSTLSTRSTRSSTPVLWLCVLCVVCCVLLCCLARG